MPVFLGILLGGLYSMVGSLVTSVLIKLGIGYVTYTGLSILMDSVASHIWSNLDSTPQTVIAVLNLLNVGKAINVILSAVAVRLVLQGFNGGSITRMVHKS